MIQLTASSWPSLVVFIILLQESNPKKLVIVFVILHYQKVTDIDLLIMSKKKERYRSPN